MAELGALRFPAAAGHSRPALTLQPSGHQFRWQRFSVACSSASTATRPPGSSSSSSSGGGLADGGGSGNVSSGRGQPRPSRRGKRSLEAEPQPQLQTWLQQKQGLRAEEAILHAGWMAKVFGGHEAALACLPATFSWCRSQGLPGLQTAQLLDEIARARHERVVRFADTTQQDWQQIDGYISAHYQRQQEAGKRLSKHASLGSVLRSRPAAGRALKVRPGHVQGWLAAVGQLLTPADIGALLSTSPEAICGRPGTAVAAIEWAANELGVTDPGSFFRIAPNLLTYDVATLQGKLENVQQAVGQSAELTRQLAGKYPLLLMRSAATVQQAAGWLRQLFPAAEQLRGVLLLAPALLVRTAPQLQRNADVLQQLGWSHERVLAYIEAYPQPFARVDLGGPYTAPKLLFLTRVVGVASVEQCIEQYGTYLKTGLATMGALYILVQDRHPALLRRKGRPSLSWMLVNDNTAKQCGMCKADMQSHVRAWQASEAGQQLLAELRSGSTAGWPRPGQTNIAQEQPPMAASGSGENFSASAAARRRRSSSSGKHEAGWAKGTALCDVAPERLAAAGGAGAAC